MLLQFSVSNYRSIKDKITFSMLSSSKNENTFKIKKYNLLNSAVIYGANASGKSNLLRAMAFMGRIVLNKTKVIQSTDTLPHDPFRLNNSTQDASSIFEIVLFIDEIKYRYGFELDNTTVYSEWLYADEKGKESKLFYRDADDEEYVNSQKFKEGYPFFDNSKSKIKISSNQLFIWKCDREDDGIISKSILKWFNRFNLIDGLDHGGYISYTMKKMEDLNFKNEMIKLVKTADIGIEDITIEEEDVPLDMIEKLSLPASIKEEILKDGGLKSVSINTYHKKFDKDNNEIGNEIFELDDEESVGTRKFFKMSAPILNTLQEGKILIIDELDASLHPMLTKHLIKLFNDKNINTKNAQLIFATHDTNLLKPEIFKRDQIWFTEKDKYGSTTLYSILEIKGVRANDDFEKQYIQGKYGAVPYLGKFEF
ncbi:ATP-binding protein [Aliarcobacter butzleri]|uniref:AAA family ATPase n=1 Tax=Aliarcobacter butzleri TaxID=28197 RepID=UPI0021B47506|nr:ATP-binding protein [Aliarcobacter butzleri]MCT7547235.1 ATP-binding protein [Aliarcobacter butzleri]